MKKNIKKIIFTFLATSLIMLTSCDELSQLLLNIPLPIEFSASGTNTSISETEFFCLTQYSEWRDNQDDIESANFLAASYWTLDGSSPNLRGNVSFSLFDGFGGLLFTVNLGNITAADYLENPYELSLNADQIQAFDAVLSNLADNDACFTATLSVTDITGDTNASGEYVLNGKVEIVLETDVNID